MNVGGIGMSSSNPGPIGQLGMRHMTPQHMQQPQAASNNLMEQKLLQQQQILRQQNLMQQQQQIIRPPPPDYKATAAAAGLMQQNQGPMMGSQGPGRYAQGISPNMRRMPHQPMPPSGNYKVYQT